MSTPDFAEICTVDIVQYEEEACHGFLKAFARISSY